MTDTSEGSIPNSSATTWLTTVSGLLPHSGQPSSTRTWPNALTSILTLSGAVRGAARTIKDKMIRIAAHSMEADPADVELVDGQLRPKGTPAKAMSMGDVAMLAHLFKETNPEGEDSGLVTTFTYDHPFVSLPSADRKDMGAFYPFVSHACHIPIVEVDVETGVVKVLKYYVVNDCGKLVNPKLVEGQIMGGIVQGIGAALMEEYRYDGQDGSLQTGTFREYLLPSMHEAPEIVIEHQETPSPFSEYGVKGAGEGGRLVAPTAMASAIGDALKPLGVTVSELPMTPERVVAAIAEARAAGSAGA